MQWNSMCRCPELEAGPVYTRKACKSLWLVQREKKENEVEDVAKMVRRWEMGGNTYHIGPCSKSSIKDSLASI